jgi:predicted P-loop ATPase
MRKKPPSIPDELWAQHLATNVTPLRGAKKAKAEHDGWLGRCLVDDRGRVVANLANAMIALRADPSLSGTVAFDEMQQDAMLAELLPIAPNAKCAGLDPVPRPLRDEDVSQLQEWLQHQGLPRIGREIVHQAVDQRARECSFHPVRDWLDGLEWDGTERLNGWLRTYLGATGPQDYLAAIGRMFLISMVARIHKPGCKVDYMLVLEGEQGVEKSRACQVLSGGWFSDDLPDIHAKDARQHLRGKWLVEIAELAAFSRADVEALKAFITRDCERYRPAYGHEEVIEPRQCVFIGTTNRSVYIKDDTGGRRFWPVAITERVKIEALARDRDQLFAEAVERYRQGEQWWPDPAFEREYIKPEQDERREPDPWEEAIAEFIENRDKVTVSEVARLALGLENSRIGKAEQNRITRVLADLNWGKAPRTGKGRWYAPKRKPMEVTK